MNEINNLHYLAMQKADEADFAKLKKDISGYNTYIKEAFEIERKAAMLLAGEFDIEPTRSVLFRSAASLGIECKEYREAERLIAYGMIGNPPMEIMKELKDLLEDIQLLQYLSLSGIRFKNLMEVKIYIAFMQGDESLLKKCKAIFEKKEAYCQSRKSQDIGFTVWLMAKAYVERFEFGDLDKCLESLEDANEFSLKSYFQGLFSMTELMYLITRKSIEESKNR